MIDSDMAAIIDFIYVGWSEVLRFVRICILLRIFSTAFIRNDVGLNIIDMSVFVRIRVVRM